MTGWIVVGALVALFAYGLYAELGPRRRRGMTAAEIEAMVMNEREPPEQIVRAPLGPDFAVGPWPIITHVEQSGCLVGSCAVYSTYAEGRATHWPAGPCPATECYYPNCVVPATAGRPAQSGNA